MESHQPLTSLCGLKDSVIEYQVTYIKEEPVSCGGGHHGDVFIPPYPAQQYDSAHVKEEPFSYEDEGVMYSHKYQSAGPTQLYTSPYMKEEPDLYDNQQVDYKPKVHVQRRSTGMKEEPDSCDRGNMYLLSGHTLQYPADHGKKEPDSGDGRNIMYTDQVQQYPHLKEESSHSRNITNPHIYTQYPSAHVKEEPQPCAGTHTYTRTDHTSTYVIKEEPLSRDEGNTMVRALNIPADHTQHLSANIKEEPDSCDEGNVSDPNIYTLIDQTPHNVSAHPKEEPFSCLVIEHSADAERCPSAHIKEEPDVGDHLEDAEIHTPTDRTRKISAGSEDEETDPGNEVDASKETPANVGVQLFDNVQKNNMDSGQNGHHAAAQSTDFTFKCLECELCFTNKSDFEEHLTLHRGKKTHVCSHCGKCFSYQSQRLIHERTHTGEKPFTCSECGKCFNQYVHLAIHLMSHTGEKPYVCTECGKSFNRKTTLTIHQRIHTGEKPFHCPQCGKYFSTSSNLIKHQRVHTGEKPYSCSECRELFVHYTQLIRHQANHSSEKPFSCSVCGKSFSQKAQFLRHERFHKADNTYSCPDCNQCFKQYKDLLVHQATHAGQNFECRECGKQFDKKWSLDSHQRSHSGENPYPCSECGKSFCLSSNLVKHQHKVHVKEKWRPGGGGEMSDHETRPEGCPTGPGEETWSCSVCGEQYRGSGTLIEHMRIHR